MRKIPTKISYRRRGDGSHIIWQHHEDFQLEVVAKIVLSDAEYKILNEHFNYSSSRLREKIQRVQSQLDDTENARQFYFAKLIDALHVIEKQREDIDRLLKGGDHPLNNLMNII